MPVIGLVGHTGAGKSTAARWLKVQHHAIVFRHSEFLLAVAAVYGLPVDALSLGRIWRGLASQFGEAVTAERVCQLIATREQSSSRLVVIDGIRIPAEVERYRRLPDFVLVKVYADQVMRYERIRNRRSRPNENEMTWSHFLTIDCSPAHRYIDVLLDAPGITLDANGTDEEFSERVEAMLQTAQQEVSARCR